MLKGTDAMETNADERILTEEELLRCDLTDEGIERAGQRGDTKVMTLFYCTHVWYYCNSPQ